MVRETIWTASICLMAAACTNNGEVSSEDLAPQEEAARRGDPSVDIEGSGSSSPDNLDGPFDGIDITETDAERLLPDVRTALAESVSFENITNIEVRHLGRGVYFSEVTSGSNGNAHTITCMTQISTYSEPGSVSLTATMCPAPEPRE